MGWNVAPCQAPGCALAAGHEGEHRTAQALDAEAQRTGPWRVLLLAVVGIVAVLLMTDLIR